MNLSLLFKMLGVKITPEQATQIEAIIPQIPGKIQQTIAVINSALQNFDQRLKDLEKHQAELVGMAVIFLEEIKYGRINDGESDDTRPAGTGDNARRFERTDGIDG